jgi:hypothetical protein
LHDLVRRRLRQEGSRELLEPYRSFSPARLWRALNWRTCFAAELKKLKIDFYEMKPGETISFRGKQLIKGK